MIIPHPPDAIDGIETPAGKNKFPRHKHVACMPPAKQNFWLDFRLINDDERGGVFGLNALMKTDTLPFDEMPRHRCHGVPIRAAATVS